MIVVDDANKLRSNLSSIVNFKDEFNEGSIKIILTVRNYLKKEVENELKNFEEIELNNFDKTELSNILQSPEYNITNYYVDRIYSISKGNPRIALMAAIAGINKDIEKLNKASLILEEYFSSVNVTIKDDLALLKVAGILSMFRSIDVANRQQLDEISNYFKIENNVIIEKLSLLVENELADVYKHQNYSEIKPSTNTLNIRFIDAVSQGLRQSMERFDKLVVMGQDIAEYGGAFKITEGFLAQFGDSRVRNTPICESAIVGAALGLSLEGIKSVMEMQFADFVTVGFNQIVNNLAKINYRWGQNADVVIRMPTGAGVGAGPFHSQSNEAWFTHVPGLKVVYPSNPLDAIGLLIAALADPNPILYFERFLCSNNKNTNLI